VEIVDEFNLSEYEEIKNDFIQESIEHLQTLEDGLLKIEQDEDYELLNTVFRAAHSIKGAANYLGLEKIIKTAHVMENILDELRNGVIKADKGVVDYLLKGVDLLRSLIYEVQTGEDKNIDYLSFINEAPDADKISEIGQTSKKAAKTVLNSDTGSSLEDTEDTEGNEQNNKFVVFKLAGQCYGVNISEVKEIVKISEITPIPYSDEHIKGLMNLRGEIITIVDIREKMHVKGENSDKSRIVILNKDDMQIGFLADQVVEVLEVQPDDIKPPVIDKGFNADYICGIVESAKDLIMLLNVNKVFDI
jgi:purine-binding chemotaxis protein CheW